MQRATKTFDGAACVQRQAAAVGVGVHRHVDARQVRRAFGGKPARGQRLVTQQAAEVAVPHGVGGELRWRQRGWQHVRAGQPRAAELPLPHTALEPQVEKARRQDATVAQGVAVEIGEALHWHDRLQVARPVLRDQPLQRGKVRVPQQPDIAVAPRLRAGPLDGFDKITLHLRAEQVQLAGRCPRATLVAADLHVAASYPVVGQRGLPVHQIVGTGAALHGLALEGIGRPGSQRDALGVRPHRHDHRPAARRARAEDVGAEAAAVAQRDRHVAIDMDRQVVGLRGLVAIELRAAGEPGAGTGECSAAQQHVAPRQGGCVPAERRAGRAGRADCAGRAGRAGCAGCAGRANDPCHGFLRAGLGAARSLRSARRRVIH